MKDEIKKVLLLGSGALKIGEAGFASIESLEGGRD